MIKVFIIISAFFIFVYSSSEKINKKIVGYTQNGLAIHCSDLSKNEDSPIYSICLDERIQIDFNSNTQNKTMITFNTALKIKDGWNILGIAHNIENAKDFLSQDCILYAKKYENGIWQEYNALNDTNTITHINSNEAIYIYSSGECTLNSYGVRIFDGNEIKIQDLNPKTNTSETNITIEVQNEQEIQEEVEENDASITIDTQENNTSTNIDTDNNSTIQETTLQNTDNREQEIQEEVEESTETNTTKD